MMGIKTTPLSSKDCPDTSKILYNWPQDNDWPELYCPSGRTHHPLSHIFLLETQKYLQHFGDHLWDASLPSSLCRPHWKKKSLSYFTTTHLSVFGFCQGWVAKPDVFGTSEPGALAPMGLGRHHFFFPSEGASGWWREFDYSWSNFPVEVQGMTLWDHRASHFSLGEREMWKHRLTNRQDPKAVGAIIPLVAVSSVK